MTTADPAFRIPDDVRKLLTGRVRTYELPANPTTQQLIAAWEMQGQLDAHTGIWVRRALANPAGEAFYMDGARKIAAATNTLIAAIEAATAAVNSKT